MLCISSSNTTNPGLMYIFENIFKKIYVVTLHLIVKLSMPMMRVQLSVKTVLCNNIGQVYCMQLSQLALSQQLAKLVLTKVWRFFEVGKAAVGLGRFGILPKT